MHRPRGGVRGVRREVERDRPGDLRQRRGVLARRSVVARGQGETERNSKVNSNRMYAVPSSPFSMTPEELTRARADLQHAEREAARATSWGHKTRWEQEAKSL